MSTPNRRCPAPLPALALAVAAASFAGPAAADQAVVASLSPPQPGLGCAEAAARTSVYFQFTHPTFAVSQISLYLDGRGAPRDAIDQHWPTVTLTRGLHAGRNTVDVVAEGKGGQRLSRRLVVLVGPSAGGDSTAPATVPCDDTLAQGEVEDDSSPLIDEPQPVIVEPPPVIYSSPPVLVEAAPVYVYRPYPVFALDAFVPMVPFFGFSLFYSNYHPYCPPPRVVYHTAPDFPLRGDDHWRGGGDRQGRGSGWHEHDRGDGWRGSGAPHSADRGHDRGNPDRSRGRPVRPMAPAPGWRSPQPVAPIGNGDRHVGDRTPLAGPPNPGQHGRPPRQQVPSAHGGSYGPPAAGGAPGAWGARPGGGRDGEHGAERGGEHHHDRQ